MPKTLNTYIIVTSKNVEIIYLLFVQGLANSTYRSKDKTIDNRAVH